MPLCGAEHEGGQTCHLEGNHEMHVAGFGGKRVMWANPDYVEPKPEVNTLTAEGRRNAEKMLREAAQRAQPEERTSLPPISEMHFDGETIEPELDQVRLGRQMQAVFDAIQDGQWHTLADLSETTGAPEASVSARLRDLRKESFGGHDVEHRRVDGVDGLWEYRLAMKAALRNFD
jgi:hypothetical protein